MNWIDDSLRLRVNDKIGAGFDINISCWDYLKRIIAENLQKIVMWGLHLAKASFLTR